MNRSDRARSRNAPNRTIAKASGGATEGAPRGLEKHLKSQGKIACFQSAGERWKVAVSGTISPSLMPDSTPIPAAPATNPNAAPTADQYTSSTIQVLEGLEAIRKRPGMYVGGAGPEGLHHLVYECVDNAIDEVMAGYATEVFVTIGVDGSCMVQDDGRGMPVDPMRHENPAINGRPAVEVILTEVHAGG